MYKSPSQIVDEMVALIKSNPKDLQQWLKSSRRELLLAHHSTGRNIRNYYKLWDKDNPYTDVDAKPNKQGIISDECHPDQVSATIMDNIWLTLQSEHGKV